MSTCPTGSPARSSSQYPRPRAWLPTESVGYAGVSPTSRRTCAADTAPTVNGSPTGTNARTVARCSTGPSGSPGATGRIVLAGASYGAFTAWAAALAAPGLASAVISEVPAAGLRVANTEPTGLLRLRESVGWWSEHADARTSRTALAGTLAGSRDAGSARAALAHLPVCEIGRRSWAGIPTWWSALQESADEHGIRDDELAACPVPALHVGGWYDLFLPQTLRHWAVAGSAHRPRPPRGLVVGPWRHELSTPTSSAAGGREHGPASQLRLGELQAGWARAILAGDDPQLRKVFLVNAISAAVCAGRQHAALAHPSRREPDPAPTRRHRDAPVATRPATTGPVDRPGRRPLPTRRPDRHHQVRDTADDAPADRRRQPDPHPACRRRGPTRGLDRAPRAAHRRRGVRTHRRARRRCRRNPNRDHRHASAGDRPARRCATRTARMQRLSPARPQSRHRPGPLHHRRHPSGRPGDAQRRRRHRARSAGARSAGARPDNRCRHGHQETR